MNLQEAIEMKIKSSYLEELQQAKEQYFHDFPKYLQVTRKLIDTYESQDMQRVAGILINEDIKKGIIRVEGSEIICNCESCQIGDKDVKEILDNAIKDLFVRPLENPLAKFKKKRQTSNPYEDKDSIASNYYEEDFKTLKEEHDKERRLNNVAGAMRIGHMIEKFCKEYNKDMHEIILELNKDVL